MGLELDHSLKCRVKLGHGQIFYSEITVKRVQCLEISHIQVEVLHSVLMSIEEQRSFNLHSKDSWWTISLYVIKYHLSGVTLNIVVLHCSSNGWDGENSLSMPLDMFCTCPLIIDFSSTIFDVAIIHNSTLVRGLNQFRTIIATIE